MALKVAIVSNEITSNENPDVYLVRDEVKIVKEILKKRGYLYKDISIKKEVFSLIEELQSFKPDVIFNLCEQFDSQSEGEFYVASLFELLGIPYTGSTPFTLALALRKSKSKIMLSSWGINVPPWEVMDKIPDRELDILYPLIVKPDNQDASLGIDKSSVVYDFPSLQKKISELLEKLKSPVLVEKYIDGREFNVAFLGDKILAIGEIIFKIEPKILTYNAKWRKGSEEDILTIPRYPADLRPEKKEEIEQIAIRAKEILEIRDYGRVDIRMDKDEKIYILEVNPNPDISLDSGFYRAVKAAKMEYEDVILEIIGYANSRRKNRRN
ncbi:MAG: ATP-grasp domain-containing protein [Acidobacteriota bacterium]